MKLSRDASSGGISFLGALTILFIGLKSGGVINWSWWAVLSPIWIPLAFMVVAAAAILALFWKADGEK